MEPEGQLGSIQGGERPGERVLETVFDLGEDADKDPVQVVVGIEMDPPHQAHHPPLGLGIQVTHPQRGLQERTEDSRYVLWIPGQGVLEEGQSLAVDGLGAASEDLGNKGVLGAEVVVDRGEIGPRLCGDGA